MGSKILSWAALISNGGIMTAIIISNFVVNGWNVSNMFFIMLASIAMFLLALRFNVTALRRDLCHRMVIPNAGLIVVSAFLLYYLLQGFIPALSTPVVMFSVIGGLIAAFAVIFIGYWVKGRKDY